MKKEFTYKVHGGDLNVDVSIFRDEVLVRMSFGKNEAYFARYEFRTVDFEYKIGDTVAFYIDDFMHNKAWTKSFDKVHESIQGLVEKVTADLSAFVEEVTVVKEEKTVAEDSAEEEMEDGMFFEEETNTLHFSRNLYFKQKRMDQDELNSQNAHKYDGIILPEYDLP